MKHERQLWKKTLKERKSRRRVLVKQELISKEIDEDLNILNESEKLFLQLQPNYSKISKNITNLVPIAVKIAQLNSHINHLNKNLSDCMNEKIYDATKQLAKLADS